MPHLCWTLALDDGTHAIEVRHNPWLGRKTVTVDGLPLNACWNREETRKHSK